MKGRLGKYILAWFLVLGDLLYFLLLEDPENVTLVNFFDVAGFRKR